MLPLRALGTWERFILDYLIGIADISVLSVRVATQKWPEELAEVKWRLESTEQPQIEEKTQKQAFQEALEKEKNQLLSEITMLQKKLARTEI